MQLQLRPTDRPGGKPAALLIKGTGPAQWLPALRGTGIDLEAAVSWAIPGAEPGSILACLIRCDLSALKDIPPTVTFLRLVGDHLYIPLHSETFPELRSAELQRMLGGWPHLLHPETGLVSLDHTLSWPALLTLPPARDVSLQVPAQPLFRPATIRGYEIKASPPEETLRTLEDEISPEPKKFEDRPLTTMEKLKLNLYRKLFKDAPGTSPEDKGFLQKKLEQLANGLSGIALPPIDKMHEDYEALERRNASEVDKLLDLLKRDPEEALKYALPLNEGTGRGGAGEITLDKRWTDFSLFGNTPSGGAGGAGILPDNTYAKLYEQYSRTAEALIAKGEYAQAAFIYLKLMRNYELAAKTLERGGMYAEAAAIHLQYTGNKIAAAECYEKGNMLTQAIDLYEEHGKFELAGDLFMRLNKRDEAMFRYGLVAEDYAGRGQFLKAAALRRDKMDELPAAQELLLQGWRTGRDSYNCLHSYFGNIPEAAPLKASIGAVYNAVPDEQRAADLLPALKPEAQRFPELAPYIRGIATELVSARAKRDPSILTQLPAFNPENTLLTKDILRYRTRPRG